MGLLIRVGEWLKFRRGYWNHAFVVSDIDEFGMVWIIQATLRGVIRSPLNMVAPGGVYKTFAPPKKCDRSLIVEFAKAQVGMHYGILTILAISIDILSWQWVPALRGARKNSWICSAMTEEALRAGGWIYPYIDIYTVTPEQSYIVHMALAA